MKLFLITIVGIVSFGIRAVSAAEEDTGNTAARVTPAPGDPGYAKISDDDKQMDRAVENAQRTLGFFMAALRAKKDGDTGFQRSRRPFSAATGQSSIGNEMTRGKARHDHSGIRDFTSSRGRLRVTDAASANRNLSYIYRREVTL